MRETLAEESKQYRLIHSDGQDGYQLVAFTAPSVASALWVARSYCGKEPCELFEQGRRLGRVNAACTHSFPVHFRQASGSG
jgi:hypothetical protein